MENFTLVVMAAGMGSRFGGLKQITPVDEEGNFIIDYSVYDAIKAGFKKVVFVIKEENLVDFKNTIGNRLEGKIKVEYAFQKKEDIPREMDISKRVKPWGTVQAILCAKDKVSSSFAVINADDFYGFNAFEQASEFLKENKNNYEYACISYPFGITASEEGAVKRGVLHIENGKINSIIESSIEAKDLNVAIASPLDGSYPFEIDINAPVSMNMFAFQHDIFNLLEDYFRKFFEQDESIILSSEALLPECLKENLEQKNIVLYNRVATSKWLGMTYKSDLDKVKKELKDLKEKGQYPKVLWK